MNISYYIYTVRDSLEHFDYAVTSDASNTIQICGMHNSEGKPVYFESEAYHLEKWCKENGLEYNKERKVDYRND